MRGHGGDHDVDISDLGRLLSRYGLRYEAHPWDGDFNADAAVDQADLGVLLANYGTRCQ
jgi:hypothetical protein